MSKGRSMQPRYRPHSQQSSGVVASWVWVTQPKAELICSTSFVRKMS